VQRSGDARRPALARVGRAGERPHRGQQQGVDVLERLKVHLAARPPRDLPPHPHRRAAVLIPVFRDRGTPSLLLTKRTETVERHKGQISFPGGGEEPDDPDLQATALRETQEEVGLHPNLVEVWGRLDEVETVVSGFAITPYVGLIPWPASLRPNPNEIAEILTVPFALFLDPANLRVEHIVRDGRPYELLFYDSPPHVIWGVTARIVQSMLAVLDDGTAGGGRR
jgi:8-oxo-dGTP pyrophosphatase MutT (NUDIX family)